MFYSTDHLIMYLKDLCCVIITRMIYGFVNAAMDTLLVLYSKSYSIFVCLHDHKQNQKMLLGNKEFYSIPILFSFPNFIFTLPFSQIHPELAFLFILDTYTGFSLCLWLFKSAYHFTCWSGDQLIMSRPWQLFLFCFGLLIIFCLSVSHMGQCMSVFTCGFVLFHPSSPPLMWLNRYLTYLLSFWHEIIIPPSAYTNLPIGELFS